jgi:hypothetical protein
LKNSSIFPFLSSLFDFLFQQINHYLYLTVSPNGAV